MLNRLYFATALASILALYAAQVAAQGETIINQAKALAGGITPGDDPGFPVTLTLPGAYIFSTNLSVTAGKLGIEVDSRSSVDIDMNGFTMDGNGVAGSGLFPFTGNGRIHNGAITRFLGNGISMDPGFPCDGWTIEDMNISGNSGSGISDGPGSCIMSIINSTISGNNEYGIRCGRDCYIVGNRVLRNGRIGVELISGLVLGNVIMDNGRLVPASDKINGAGIFAVPSPLGDIGYGNNVIAHNNHEGQQVFGVVPLDPNVCLPTCPKKFKANEFPYGGR